MHPAPVLQIVHTAPRPLDLPLPHLLILSLDPSLPLGYNFFNGRIKIGGGLVFLF